jgi:hypothetical protein
VLDFSVAVPATALDLRPIPVGGTCDKVLTVLDNCPVYVENWVINYAYWKCLRDIGTEGLRSPSSGQNVELIP